MINKQINFKKYDLIRLNPNPELISLRCKGSESGHSSREVRHRLHVVRGRHSQFDPHSRRLRVR